VCNKIQARELFSQHQVSTESIMHFFTGFDTTHRLKTLLKGSAITAALTLSISCGGGSSGSPESEDDTVVGGIQGDWSSQCFQASPELSGINELTITASDYNQSTLFFVGSTTCSGQLNFLLESEGTYTLGAGTTPTVQGVASHIDIEFGNITATSTLALDGQLALDERSFGDLLSEQLNIADVDNISSQDLGLPPTLFSLILVDGDNLLSGDSDSNQGNSPETRLTELSTEFEGTFTRQ